MRADDVSAMVRAHKDYERLRRKVLCGADAEVAEVDQWVADGRAFRELLAVTGAQPVASMEHGGIEWFEFEGCVFVHKPKEA